MQVTCTAHSQLEFSLADDRIAGSAARRTVPVETRRAQSGTAVLLRDAASTEESGGGQAQLTAGCYQWPVTVQLPDDAAPTMAYRGVWLGVPDATVMCDFLRTLLPE